MKIKTLLLVILLSLLAFYNSAEKFDEENYDAYYNGIFATERIGIGLNITANSPSQNSDILRILKQGCDQYHLSVYSLCQGYKLRAAPYDTLLFAYSSDVNYMDNLVPYGNQPILSLVRFDRYLSHDSDSSKRLFTVLDQRVYGMMPMNSQDPLFTVNGYYKLFANEGYDVDKQFALFEQYLQDNLSGKAIYNLKLTHYQAHEDVPKGDHVPPADAIFIILLVGIITLMLNSALFRMQKEISVRKLEGNSIFGIFWGLYFKWFLLYIPFGVALLAVLSAVTVHVPAVHLLRFAKLLGANVVLFYGISVLISLLLMITIAAVPVNLGIKGQNFNKSMKYILQAIKLGILVLSVEIVVTGIRSVVTFTSNAVEYPKRTAHFKNMYEIVGTRMDAIELQPDGTYISQFNAEAEKRVIRVMAEDNGIFVFSPATAGGEDESEWIDFFIADYRYLQRCGFDTSVLNDDYDNYLIPKGTSEKYRKDIQQLALFSYPGESPDEAMKKVRIYEYDLLLNYDFENDFQKEYMSQIILVRKPADALGSYTYFRYEGGLKEAQDYLDQLQIQYGEKPYCGIQSCEESFSLRYKSYQTEHFKKILAFVLWLVMYCLLDVQIMECDYAENAKQYFIEYTEDTKIGKFGKDYLATLLVLFSVSILSRFGMKTESYRETAGVYLGLFALEAVISVFYHRKTVNANKGGSDLWK